MTRGINLEVATVFIPTYAIGLWENTLGLQQEFIPLDFTSDLIHLILPCLILVSHLFAFTLSYPLRIHFRLHVADTTTMPSFNSTLPLLDPIE